MKNLFRTPLVALLLVLLPLLTHAGTPVLTLQATVASGGSDVTAFVDQVEIINVSTGAVVANVVANSNFANSGSIGNGTYGYNPTGAVWSFASQSGITANGGPFSAPASPEGAYVAFLQSNSGGAGSISQMLALAPGYYQVRVLLAQRNTSPANQGVALLVDGREVGRNIPANDGVFHSFTSAVFPIDQTVLRLEANVAAASGVNETAFVDAVELLRASTPVTVANASFETFTAPLGSGGGTYGYTPAGASWAFASNSGIAANGSPIGNPTTADGTYAAFLQTLASGAGAFEQGLPALLAGSYSVRLKAALGSTSTAQGIRVLLGGTLLGTITPSGTSFQQYTTGTSESVALPAIGSFSPTTALVGTSVTLTGSNLSGAAYVSIDGVTVVPTSVSSTSLSFVLPTGVSGTPRIVVTTPFGPSAASTAFTVSTLPNISSFTPTSGPLGGSISLTGLNLTGASTIRFTGTSNNTVTTGFTVASSTSITGIVVPIGAQTGPLTVTTPNGTSAASTNFTVCRVTAIGQNASLTLPDTGTGTLTATAFDNGSTSTCAGALTPTVRRGGIVFGTVSENSPLALTAPAGYTFTTVDFASYGNPSGSAGSYTRGSCHASSSQSVVQTALLGRTGTVTITPTNAMFGGDPCSGTAKSLAIRAFYTPTVGAIAAASSVSFGCSDVGTWPMLLTVSDAPGGRATVQVNGTVTAPPTATISSVSPATATVGQLMTVVGTNLGGATALTVNGASAAISNLSPTGFTFIVPAGAVPSGNLVLTLPCAQTITRAFTVTFVPAITSLSTTSGPVGSTLSITGTGLFGATTVTFAGSSNNTVVSGFTVNAAGTSITGIMVPVGAETGTLTVTSTSTSAPSSQSFTVVATPVIVSFTPASGIIGTSVTLTGTNLTGAMALTLNGVAVPMANVTANTSTSLTFTVPNGATSGPIAVTAAIGTSPPSLQSFLVTPTITAFTPTSGVVGSSVTLTGTGLTGATAVTFSGTSGNVVSSGFVVNAAGTSITGIAVPAGGVAGPLTVTTAGGTSAPSSQSFAVCRLIAAGQNAALTLGADGTGSIAASAFDAGSSSACSGPVTFSASKGSAVVSGVVFGTAAEGGTLTLTAPAGAVFTAVNFASYGNPTGSAGTYTQRSCHASTSQSVVAAALLGRSGSVDIAATNANFGGDPCSGTAKILAVRATYATPLSATLSYSCTELGSQPVTLTVADAAGASTTVLLNVTVTAPPTATITSVSPQPAAIGATVTVVGTNLGGATALTVNGATAATSNVTATGFTFVVPAGATATGNLVLTLPCSQSLTRTFNAGLPGITSLAPASGWTGTSATLTGTNLGSATGLTLNGVAVPLANITANTGTSLTFTVPSGATTGTITVTTASGTSAPSSQTFFIIPPPSITSFTPSTGLTGSSVTLTGVNLGGATGLTLNGVAVPLANITANTSTSLTFTVPIGATTGTLTVTTNSGTSSASSTTYTVLPSPTLSSIVPAVGVAGTVLTLTGTNLAGTTSLSFMGGGANVVTTGFVVNAAGTQITGVVVPVGAMSGPITVTASAGLGGLGTAFFTRANTLSAGDLHNLSVRPDGSLWVWGANYLAQLGTGDGTIRRSPVLTYDDASFGMSTNWRSVAAGSYFSLALKTNGSLWVWANSDRGQLGVAYAYSVPTQPNPATDWVSVAAGYQHTMAIKTNGTLWATGDNRAGKLGDGTTAIGGYRDSFGQVGTATNWVSASVGSNHTVAIRADGTLWTWGFNYSGQLGNGTTTDGYLPAQVGTATNWVTAAAGQNHVVAVRADGTLWAWGYNGSGQLGDGTTTNRNSPVQIGTATNWIRVAGGNSHTVAVRADGTLWAWGDNSEGQLGDASKISHLSPAQVGTDTGWLSATAGQSHSAGEQTCRSVWTWGDNGYGQIGDGTSSDRTSPVRIYNALALATFVPASAPIGATVVVTGTGLAGLTSLTVNGASVALTDISNNTSTGFSFVVPAGATATGTTTVTAGCGTNSSTAFQVLPLITSFTPAIGPVGTSVTITGTGLGGATAVQFNGTRQTTITANTTTSLTVVVPSAATSGFLTVTTAGGTSAASSQSFTVCRVVASTQNQTLALATNGTGSILASGFDTGSTSNCNSSSPITASIRKAGVVYGTANENGTLTLTAPAGTTFAAVEFASYGNPSGSAGNYTRGSCHAAASQGVVETALLGRTGAVSIAVNNAAFGGDPCANTAKALTVRALYVATAATSAATLSYTCAELGAQPVLMTLTDNNSLSSTVGVQVTVTGPPMATLSSASPQPAVPGTTVAVVGTNLGGATALTVNGASAAISNLTATGFTFVVPAGATGAGSLVLTLPCAQAPVLPFDTSLPGITSFTPTIGGVGASVTLTGTNLTGATALTLNGVAVPMANITANTGTSLTFTVPSGATTGTITVTTASGTSAPSSQTFYVPPVITSFTPTGGVAGNSVTITGANLTGATAITFSGTSNNVVSTGFTIVSNTSLTGVVVPSGAITGPITVTTPGGTSAASSQSFIICQVTAVGQNAALTLGANGTGSIAASALNNGSTSSCGTAVTATARRGGVVFGTAAENAGLILTAPAGYVFTAVEFASYGNATGSAGNYTRGTCHAAASQSVMETFLLGRTGSVGVAAINTAFGGDPCPGTAKTLTVRATYGVAGATNDATLNYTCADLGAQPVLLTMTDASGARRTAGMTVTVTAPPTATITSVSPQPAALGATVTVVGTNLGGATALTVNGASAAISNLTATGFTFVVPAGATATGNLVLTLPCSQSLTRTFNASLPGITSFTPTSGGTGTSVTITGTNLGSATGLGLNGVAIPLANITANTGTSLTFTVPGGATTGTITVTTAGGTSVPSSQIFYASPVVSGFAPASGPVGTLVVITGTNLTGATAITFSGTSGNVVSTGFTIASNTSLTGVVVPVGAITGPITVTTPGGTSAASSTNFIVTLVVPTLASLNTLAELPGMPVTLTGTGFTSGSGVSFGGVAAGSVTVNSPTSLTAVVPAGTPVGSSAVVVSTAGGSSVSSPAFTVLGVYDGGSLNACALALPATATTGDGAWHYLLSSGGQVVLAYNYSGPGLGSFSAELLRANPASAVRQDARGHKYLDRNWHLSASGGTFAGRSVQLRLYGLSSELARLQAADATVTLAGLNATQYSGVNEDCDLGNNSFITADVRTLPAPASAPASTGWFVSQLSVADHFSEFFLTGSSAPLPVELLSFTAEMQGSAVALAWRTASEKNSARFEVERSNDGKQFERIGAVAAQGTSIVSILYAFRDRPSSHQSTNSFIYYRLRQVDLDSSFSYSPVRAVAGGRAASAAVVAFPVPAHAGQPLTVDGLPAGAAVALLDALGRFLTTATADDTGKAQLALPAGLAAGVYVLRSGPHSQRLTVE